MCGMRGSVSCGFSTLRSTEKVLNVRIIEEMENGYLYIEDLGIKTE